jgi:hypothetical protein
MRIPKVLLRKTTSVDVELQSQTPPLPKELEQYHVSIIPERHPSIRWLRSLQGPRTVTCAVVVTNCVCAIIQTLDVYKLTHPGSRLTAEILKSHKTGSIWQTFFLLFTVSTPIVNAGLLFTSWGKAILCYGWRMRRRWLGLLYTVVTWGVIMLAIFGPIWITWVIRGGCKTMAWRNACKGWDLTAVFYGVKYSRLLPFLSPDSRVILGLATVSLDETFYSMQLLQQDAMYEKFVFTLWRRNDLDPVYKTIFYDTAEPSYTISNATVPFDISPNLNFPSLDLELRDPAIPFLRDWEKTSAPTADLVHRNESGVFKVLQTAIEDPKYCTVFKVCGARGFMPEFEIALGVIAIEKFRAGIYCSRPSGKGPEGWMWD